MADIARCVQAVDREMKAQTSPTDDSGGRLVIAGTGITAVSHMTLETIGHIKAADIVFYHVTNGVAAAYIKKLNPNVVDLLQYFEEEQSRDITYIQIAELMLQKVRARRNVVGIFHGHPGFFVMAARRALTIAEMEGYETHLLPGISSADSLLADLRIDPGVGGLQIAKAGAVLRGEMALATAGNVVLLQIGSVGDNSCNFTGSRRAEIARLFERLTDIYGDQHEAVYYVAAVFPGHNPTIVPRTLAEYRDPSVLSAVGFGSLYLPPLGTTWQSTVFSQSLRDGRAYGELELDAIAKLDAHQERKDQQMTPASRPVLHAMEAIGTDPVAAAQYRLAPVQFLGGYPDLLPDEQEALLKRRPRDLLGVMQRGARRQN